MSFKIDPAHSQIQFSVRHMMISKVRGSFEKFDGTVNLDEQKPAHTTVDVQIDASSINTRDETRDNHLKSPDFLDAAKYPYITFKSKRVDVKDNQHARVVGDLKIRDITHEVTVDVEFNGQAKSPWGTVSYGFNGHTVINRKDWNLTWNQTLETGGVLVGDEISVDIELELVRQEQDAQKLAAEEANSIEKGGK